MHPKQRSIARLILGLEEDLIKRIKSTHEKELSRHQAIIYIITCVFCDRRKATDYLDVLLERGLVYETEGKMIRVSMLKPYEIEKKRYISDGF